jgi:hypothetical protein
MFEEFWNSRLPSIWDVIKDESSDKEPGSNGRK